MANSTLGIKKVQLRAMILLLLGVSSLLSGCSSTSNSLERPKVPITATIVLTPAEPDRRSVLTATFTDGLNPAEFIDLRVLINTEVDGRHACYVYFDPAAGRLSLVKDSGEGSETISIGEHGSTTNSQCSLAGQTSSTSQAGEQVSLRLDLTFSASFRGPRNVYLFANTRRGESTGFIKAGVWDSADQ